MYTHMYIHICMYMYTHVYINLYKCPAPALLCAAGGAVGAGAEAARQRHTPLHAAQRLQPRVSWDAGSTVAVPADEVGIIQDSLYKYMCIYICIYVFACLHMYTYIKMFIYLYLYMYVCIHIYRDARPEVAFSADGWALYIIIICYICRFIDTR